MLWEYCGGAIVEEKIDVQGVTQCQPEDTHGEFKPSNRNELLPKSPPFHAKGRRSTDPITNARCKGTDGSGNGSGRLHGYIPRGYFNPSLSPSTKQYSVPADRQRKTFFLTFSPRITIYTNKYMDIDVYSFPQRLDVMILNANYLEQRG